MAGSCIQYLTFVDYLTSFQVFVFIHKVDGLSEDQRADAFRDINFRVNDELNEAEIAIPYKIHLTSVYDYSIFKALSVVGQKLIPEVRNYVVALLQFDCILVFYDFSLYFPQLLHTFEDLLNALRNPCGMDRALLFDVATKCYIATDDESVPTDKYEMCCDMLDLVADVSNIYTAPEASYFYDSKSFSLVHLNNGTVSWVC